MTITIIQTLGWNFFLSQFRQICMFHVTPLERERSTYLLEMFSYSMMLCPIQLSQFLSSTKCHIPDGLRSNSHFKDKVQKIFLTFLLDKNKSTDSIKNLKKVDHKGCLLFIEWSLGKFTIHKTFIGENIEKDDDVQETSEKIETKSFQKLAEALPDLVHVDRYWKTA